MQNLTSVPIYSTWVLLSSFSLLVLNSCGVKGRPTAPPGTELESALARYQQNSDPRKTRSQSVDNSDKYESPFPLNPKESKKLEEEIEKKRKKEKEAKSKSP